MDDFWQQVGKFIFIVSHLPFSQVPTLYATDGHREAEITLKIHSSSLTRLCATHFWPFSTFVWVSSNTLGTTGLDQLTSHCCSDKVFLTLLQKRGDDKLWLLFCKKKRSHNLSSPRFWGKGTPMQRCSRRNMHCCQRSGVPRVSRARGQTQFWRPHPARSWQHRCEEWVGNKGASKVDSGPAIACI